MEPGSVIVVLILAVAMGWFVYVMKTPPPVEDEPEPEPEPEEHLPPEEPFFTEDKYSGLVYPDKPLHHLIWAPTGHGKTEFVKMLLLDRLEDWQDNKLSIVVIDTKGDLIDDILEAKEFCTKKTIVIDPRDTKHPFNLSFINFDKFRELPDEEREMVYAGVVDMFITALGSADADMTGKQTIMFNNAFKLLTVVPGATLMTMVQLFKEGSQSEFQPHIDKLDEIPRGFFNDLFYKGRTFKETKEQVYYRLISLFDHPIIGRAFSDPNPAFSFLEEFEKGSLVLINISTMQLKQGAAAFGRFIMSMMMQAVEERPGRLKSKPVRIFADEAYVYFDENAADIFVRARSANVAISPIIPTGKLLTPTLRDVMLESTRTKTLGGLSKSNARVALETIRGEPDPEEVTSLRDGEMLTYSVSPLAYRWEKPQVINYSDGDVIPVIGYYSPRHKMTSSNYFGVFENNTHPSTEADRQAVMDRTRERFAVKPRAKTDETPDDDDNSPEDDPTIPELR